MKLETITEIFGKKKKVTLDKEQVQKVQAGLELIITHAEKGLDALHDLKPEELKDALTKIDAYNEKIYDSIYG